MPRKTKRKKPSGGTSKTLHFHPVVIGRSAPTVSVNRLVVVGGSSILMVVRPGGEVRIAAKHLRQVLGVPTQVFVGCWVRAIDAPDLIVDSSKLGVDRPSNPISDRGTLSVRAAMLICSQVRSGSMGLDPSFSVSRAVVAAMGVAREILEDWHRVLEIQQSYKVLQPSGIEFH